MKYFKSIFQITAFIFFTGTAVAQQVPMYSQYIMNGFLINPSLAGRDGYTTVNLTAREQWVGMSGAPRTLAASFQTRLLKNSFMSRSHQVRKRVFKPSKGSNVGLGGYLFNDNNGIVRRTGFQAAYAYHISMGRSSGGLVDDLAFGLALTTYQYAINDKGLLYSYDDDTYWREYDKVKIIPDANFGVCYTSENYYVGFSMTNMLRGSLMVDNTSDKKSLELGHFFLTGGYSYDLDRDWAIKPSALIKSSDMLFKSIQLDLTARVYYKKDYWAGLSWRTNDAIITMFGFRYDKFYFGYAFDMALTDIRKQTYGSHEITLVAKFGESARRFRWLNSF
ncbi:MAG TPA: type IX secretion system membrane protein PorP/SprF [Bacteroidales bacterium]|nr:type IX secretion system membrane protein PorP/SprF [Bacteroidales bacterium]